MSQNDDYQNKGSKKQNKNRGKMTTNSELDATFELTEKQAFQQWKKDIESDGPRILELLDAFEWVLEEENEEEN